jgi:hypothetical protein
MILLEIIGQLVPRWQLGKALIDEYFNELPAASG